MGSPDSLISYPQKIYRSFRTFSNSKIGEINQFNAWGRGESLPDINTTRELLADVCTERKRTDISAMHTLTYEINERYGRSLRDDFRQTSEFPRDHNNRSYVCVSGKSRKPLIRYVPPSSNRDPAEPIIFQGGLLDNRPSHCDSLRLLHGEIYQGHYKGFMNGAARALLADCRSART